MDVQSALNERAGSTDDARRAGILLASGAAVNRIADIAMNGSASVALTPKNRLRENAWRKCAATRLTKSMRVSAGARRRQSGTRALQRRGSQ